MAVITDKFIVSILVPRSIETERNYRSCGGIDTGRLSGGWEAGYLKSVRKIMGLESYLLRAGEPHGGRLHSRLSIADYERRALRLRFCRLGE